MQLVELFQEGLFQLRGTEYSRGSSERSLMSRSPTNLVWLDLETTGLNVETRAIIEIATIITDKDLNVIAEGPDLVIRQPESTLGALDEWCRDQHGASGLLRASRQSTVSLEDAENQTLAFVKAHCPPRACPLAGNSICFDRRFLIRYMPRLEAHLNYRNVDVSTLKELCYRWRPGVMKTVVKESTHRALDDIRESIDELRHYREKLFGGLHG